MKHAFKKFITPEQINMLFVFASVKCQAKQFSKVQHLEQLLRNLDV